MPLSFPDVYSRYLGSNLKDRLSVGEFARLGDVMTQPGEFSAAVGGTLGLPVQKGSYWLNKGLEATGVPQATGRATGELFNFFNAPRELGERIGAGIPRSIVNFAPMIAGSAIAAMGAPETGGASLAVIPTLIGTGLSGALGSAEAYGETGSGKQAATAFAMPFVGLGAGQVAGRASSALMKAASEAYPGLVPASFAGTENVVGNVIQRQLTTMPAKLTHYAGEQAGAIAAMEAANRLVNGSEYPLLSKETLLSQIANVPFMLTGVPGLLGNKVVAQRPTPEAEATTIKAVTPTKEDMAKAAATVPYEQQKDAILRSGKSDDEIQGLLGMLDIKFGRIAPKPKGPINGKTLGVPTHEATIRTPDLNDLEGGYNDYFQSLADEERQQRFRAIDETVETPGDVLARLRDSGVAETELPEHPDYLAALEREQVGGETRMQQFLTSLGQTPKSFLALPSSERARITTPVVDERARIERQIAEAKTEQERLDLQAKLASEAFAKKYPKLPFRYEAIRPSITPLGPIDAGNGATYRLHELIRTLPTGEVTFGGSSIAKDGTLPMPTFLARAGRNVSGDELALWQRQVPEAFDKGRVNIDVLQRGLAERPAVMENNLTVAANDISANRRSAIEHELDTLRPNWRQLTQPQIRELAQQGEEGAHIVGLVNERDRISPSNQRESRLSPSWTGRGIADTWSSEQASGKVEIALGHKIVESGDLTLNTPGDVLHQSQHYSGPEGANQLGLVRYYVHEYQPGARMPNGAIATTATKWMEVIEVQSDWANERERARKMTEGPAGQPGNTLAENYANAYNKLEHPLLPHWESLAYKAALKKARSIGADYLTLSDAETAMMTEGHDRAVPRAQIDDIGKWFVEDSDGTKEIFRTEKEARHSLATESAKKGGRVGQFTAADAQPSQSKGMRAAYDVRGPAILTKLTGERGVPVEYGVHEKQSRAAEARANQEAFGDDPATTAQFAAMRGEDIREPNKGSPVFKGANGQPKISNTARSFFLSRARLTSEQQPLIGYTRLADLRAKIDAVPSLPAETLTTDASVQGEIAKANTLATTFGLEPYEDPQLAGRIVFLTEAGNSPTDAAALTAAAVVNETKPRAKRSVESLAKSARGGLAGGRPRGRYTRNQREADEVFNDWVTRGQAGDEHAQRATKAILDEQSHIETLPDEASKLRAEIKICQNFRNTVRKNPNATSDELVSKLVKANQKIIAQVAGEKKPSIVEYAEEGPGATTGQELPRETGEPLPPEAAEEIAAVIHGPQADIDLAFAKETIDDHVVQTLMSGDKLQVLDTVLNHPALRSEVFGDKFRALSEQNQQIAMRRGLMKMLREDEAGARAFLKDHYTSLMTDPLMRGASGEEARTRLMSLLGSDTDELRPAKEEIFKQNLVKRGIEMETADALTARFFTPLFQHLGVDNVLFGQIINDKVSAKPVQALTPVTGPLRAILMASEVPGKAPMDVARATAIALAHETGHTVEWMHNNGLLGEEGSRKYLAARDMFAKASPEENARTLSILKDILPKEWQDNVALKGMLSPANGDEAMATAHAMWALSSFAQKGDVALAATVGPRGLRQWLGVLNEWGRKLWGAVKGAFWGNDLGVHPDAKVRIDDVVSRFEAMHKDVIKAEENVQKFQALFGADSRSFVQPLRTSNLVFDKAATTMFNGETMRAASFDVGPETVPATVFRKASELLEFGEQFAARVPAIGEAMWGVMGQAWQKHAIQSKVLAPIHGEFDPDRGVRVLSKERQRQLDIVTKQTTANKLVGDVLRWQRDNDFVAFDLANPEKSDKALAARLDADEDKQAVLQYLAGQRESNKLMQEVMLDGTDKTNRLNLAYLIASRNPTLHDVAHDTAQMIYHALYLPMDNPTRQPLLDRAKTAIGDDAIFGSVFAAAGRMQAAQTKFAEMLATRPGFASQLRAGKFLIRGFDFNGQQIGGDVVIQKGSERAMAEKTLRDQGAVMFKSEDVRRKWIVPKDDETLKALDNMQNTVRQALQEHLGDSHTEALNEFWEANSLRNHFTRLAEGSTLPEGTEGADNIDMVENHRAYVDMMSNAITAGTAKARMAFELENPKVADLRDQVRQVKQAFYNYQVPDSQLGRAVTKLMAVNYLGFNIPTNFAELFQGAFTIFPQVVAQTNSVVKSTKMMMGALKDIGSFYVKKGLGKLGGKEEWQMWDNAEERSMLRSVAEAGLLSRHAFNEGLDEEGLNAVRLRQAADQGVVGKALEVPGKMWKAYADITMKFYENFTRFNARLSSILGYRMAREVGRTHAEAVEDTMRFATTTTFAGGKAGRPVLPFSGQDHTLGQIAFSLQRYTAGWAAMMGRFLQHALMKPEDARRYGLTEGQQKAAAKAAGVMALAQFGAAGALGLPFVGAGATILEKILGKDIKASAYNAIAQVMGQDEKEGGLIGDVVMRGGANALLARLGVPIDMAARFAIGGVPGMSEYAGFDPGQVFGPTASFVKGIVTGTSALALDGDVVTAGKAALPPGMRKALDVWANGDATDTKGRPLGLDDREKTLYAIGFSPDRVRKLKDLERYTTLMERNQQRRDAKDTAQVADLVEAGDFVTAQQKLMELSEQSEGTRDPSQIARAVAKKVVDRKTPSDPRAGANRQVAEQQTELMRSMGIQISPSDELGKTLEMQRILHMLGAPHIPMGPHGTPMSRAARIDAMTAANPLSSFQQAFSP